MEAPPDRPLSFVASRNSSKMCDVTIEVSSGLTSVLCHFSIDYLFWIFSQSGKDLLIGAAGMKDWRGGTVQYSHNEEKIVNPPDSMPNDCYAGGYFKPELFNYCIGPLFQF